MSEGKIGDYLFSGLKVVDMASVIAGPVAATILADFGADVVKVEPPGMGDMLRWLSDMPSAPSAFGNYFWQMDGRNKRSITLDLKTAEGLAVLRRMIEQCDVLVTNQPMAARRKMGLTYEDAKALNPAIIYASLTAYGENGPLKDAKGFDLTAYWSHSGLMDLVREPGARPAQAVPGMGDHPTAVSLYAGIVTALLKRERTGEGSMVHTSLLANGLWAASAIAQGALAGADMDDFHSRRTHAAIHQQAFECADGRHLQLLALQSPDAIYFLFMTLDLLDVLSDPQMDPAAALQEKLLTETSDHWRAFFKEAGLPVGRVKRVEEATVSPQVEINKIAVPPVDEGAGVPLILNHPVKVDGIEQVGPRRAPNLGEHTREVLDELGYSDDEIANMAAKNIF